MHIDVVTQTLYSIQNEANEVFYSILQDQSPEAGMEATQKMKALVADLNKLKSHNQSRKADIDVLLDKVTSMQHEILDSILEPCYLNNLNEKRVVSLVSSLKCEREVSSVKES